MITYIIFLCITILFISIMVIWSITSTNPNSGTVQDLGNGQFNFPTNSTSDNITYNVNYTDDNGCTAQTTYTVPFCPLPSCSCDSFDVTRSITMPASGDTTGAIGSWTDGCPPTVNSKPDWVTVDINDRHYITVSADENTSSDERNGVVTFSYNGEICDKKIDVTQEGNSQCNCSYFDVSSSETFQSSGGSIGSIGSWTDVCPPTVNSKPDWVTVNINDDHSIMASADENTSSNQRNGVVTFSYNGEICDKKMNVIQYAKKSCRTITWGGTFFNISGIEDYPVDQGGIYIGLYNMVINYAYPDCNNYDENSITLDCVCSNYFCSNTNDSRIVNLETTSYGDALNINRMEGVEEVFHSGGEREVRDTEEDLPQITNLDTTPSIDISWGCGTTGYKYNRMLHQTYVWGIGTSTLQIEFEADEPFEGTTLTAEVSLNVNERYDFINISIEGMGSLHE